jgi:hypothetical protein
MAQLTAARAWCSQSRDRKGAVGTYVTVTPEQEYLTSLVY